MLKNRSPSCKLELSALVDGSLAAIWYTSAKLFTSLILVATLLTSVILLATVLTFAIEFPVLLTFVMFVATTSTRSSTTVILAPIELPCTEQ